MNPIADKTNEPITTSLEYTLALLRTILRVPQSTDVVIRRMKVAGFPAAILFIDGMINATIIDMNVLEPAMQAGQFDGEPSERAEWLLNSVLTVSSATLTDQIDEIVDAVLQGNTALLVEGCMNAILVDAKGFVRRPVGKPVNETTVTGPQEGFVENMRTNISLIRRIVQSPRLVVETHQVGTGIKTACSMLYLDGVANEQILTEARRRLNGINIDFVINVGELEQLIEDSPSALVPQFVHTERPDRVASFLIDGMIAVLVEGSPIALGMPATLISMFHTSEETSLRYPLGTFKRIVSFIGIVVTTLLPAIYISLLMYHNEVLPLSLMFAIYETQARIPIQIIIEFISLSIGFELINLASARIPGVLAHGLGVVSALILGQAVIAANLVSPQMIIVVAISSLGPQLVGEYHLALGHRVIQLASIAAAALGGLFGVMMVAIVAAVELCSMTSMGVPFISVTAPQRMHNPDVFATYPIWQQRIRQYLVNPDMLLRAKGRARAWDNPEDRHGKK